VVDLLGAMAQSGSFSVQLSQGDFFAFSQQTIDNFPGAATTRISNFRVEGLRSVPEPSSLILLAAAMIAAGAVSRRRVV